MPTAHLMRSIDAYMDCKVRAMLVQTNVVHVNELRKRTVLERAEAARVDLERLLAALLDKVAT